VPSDEQLIRALVADWMRASVNGDVAALSRLMSEDVVFLAPGAPAMRGRALFLSMFEAGHRTMRLEPTAEIQEIQISGNLAYLWNKLSVKVTPLRDGTPTVRVGYALSILRKQGDGSWVISRDANLLVPESESRGIT
jgi:uncharacterized protein (TIGR02246 family)